MSAVDLVPSHMVARGTVVRYQATANRELTFIHPLDLLVLQHPGDDLITRLERILAWLVQDALRKFDARTRFREKTR